MTQQECNHCHKILSIDNFYFRNTYHTYYKVCKKCRQTIYYADNKDTTKYKANVDRYRKSAGCAFQDLRKGAKRRGIEFNLNIESFEVWFNSEPRICSYCDLPQEHLQYCYPDRPQKRLSIDRKDNTTYRHDNLCFACDVCNVMKSNILSSEEMREVGQKYIKPRWQNKLQLKTQEVI